MTITKLLGGVAVAALIGTSAQAQVAITRAGTTADNLPLRVTDAAGTAAFSAAEFQPATASSQLTGKVVVTTTFGDAAPFASAGVTDRVRLTVTLTNASWTTASGGTLVNPTSDGAGGTTPTNATKSANCAFETSPVAGGGVGNTTVTFLSTAGAKINECIGATPTFTFDAIRRTSNNAPVGVSFSFAQVDSAGNNPGTTITKALTLADTASAWGAVANNHKFTADATAGPTSSTTGILTANTVLGTVRTSFRDQAPTGVTGEAAQDIRVGAAAGDKITPALLFVDGKLHIDFPQGAAGISKATFATAGGTSDCAAPVTTTAPAQRITCTLTAANLGTDFSAARAITIVKTEKAVATPEQTPTATLEVTTQTGYVATGFGPTPLRALTNDDGRVQSDNLITGALSKGKWTSFGSGGTESQFRISGLTAAQAANAEAIRITVAAGGNNVPVAPATPGYYTLTNTGDPATGFAVRGGTLVFNSKGLGVAAGMGSTSGNADITSIVLRYIGASVPAVTIDRQLANRNPTSIVAVPAN